MVLNEKFVRKGFEKVKKDVFELKKALFELNVLNKRNSQTIWFSGLPCSGKTTLAKKLEIELRKKGFSVVRLDGDNLRQGINSDLDFSEKDRNENIRRVAHIAKLFNEQGSMVLASFITPLKKERKFIREIISNLELIFLDCSLKECERRDVKGMYKLARAKKIKNFTGVDSLFEPVERADLVVNTEKETEEECVKKIILKLGL